MKSTTGIIAVCVFATMTGVARGQATTVQQPVFKFFSTGTTVTVPDQGAALLGGTSSARVGATSRSIPMLGRLPVAGRLFNNRAIGAEFGNSTNYAQVTIIDHREWDEAILNGARQPIGFGSATPDPVQQRAQFLTRHTGRRPDASRIPPQDPAPEANVVAELNRRNAEPTGCLLVQSPGALSRQSAVGGKTLPGHG